MPIIENQSEGYCEQEDVFRYFKKQNPLDAANLTSAYLDDMILEWSSYIDRETGHAWRENTVENEYRELQNNYDWWTGRPIPLEKRAVRQFDPQKGDKLELWNGSEYDDWVADDGKTQGRNGDYWIDSDAGTLYIYRRYSYARSMNLRITYRYGEEQVPRQIQMACAKLVASDLIQSDTYSQLVPGTDSDEPSPARAAEQYREQAERVIEQRKEVRYIEPW